ncbi:MAG: VWA domain-containing protein [Ktedonobacteraceae bacterium]|nr:VWA domain-containing protein [Ktedonobacteraceae bacterium]
MSILVPAALAFSVIIPIILLLYFMRPKRQERVVGSTLLWQQAMQDLQASRPWQRLRITPLLLLQLLAALAIILVLIRPAIFMNSPVSGNTIIVLQASASMQATDVNPSRFENAKNTISDYIAALGPNDHLSLITMARTPQVLIVGSQDKGQLQNALQRAKVTNQDADLEQALSLANSLALSQANAQVMVIGDGHVMNSNQAIVTQYPVRYMAVGTDAPNAALMALSSRSIQGQLIAFAQVTNYSHQTRAIPVELYADNRLFGIKTVTLAAGTSGAVQWGPLAQTTSVLHARIVTQDAMTIDHEAWALVGSSIHGRVLLVTKGNMYLETALRLQSNVELFETTPDTYSNIGNNYDLTVFDGYAPPTLPSSNLLFLNPPNKSYTFGTSSTLTSVSHISAGNDTLSLLKDVDLSSIHTLRASHQLKPSLWAQAIITSPEAPLLLAGENNNQRIAVFGFDLHETNLPLESSFPILMLNMMNWFLPSPVAGNGQVSAGVPVKVDTWPGSDLVTVTGPDQQSTTVGPPFPVTPYAKTNSVGIYQVAQHVRGRTLNGAFTVNLFDPTQSNLVPARALPIINSTTITGTNNTISHQLREIWPWIAAVLLLILCVEWWFFSRSYRTQGSTSQQNNWGQPQRGNRRATPRNALLTRLQDQVEDRFTSARRRIVKIQKRVRGRLKQPAKGERRANI